MLVEGTKEREREEREERVPDCLVGVAFRVINDGALNTLANATLEVHNHAIRKPHFLGVGVHSFLCHGRALVDTLLSRPLTRLTVVASGRKKALESLDLTIETSNLGLQTNNLGPERRRGGVARLQRYVSLRLHVLRRRLLGMMII